MAVDRILRVNELLKREIAMLLELRRPPEWSGALVSVTEVRCSSDLRNASVGLSVFGAENGDVLSFVRRMRPEIQRKLARNLGFKHTPVLEFRIDGRIAAGDRVLEMLNASDQPEEREE